MGAGNLQQNMQQTIRREQLLSPDDVVLVAFSGGADSAALLHALCAMKAQGELAGVCAAHVHHGLRGADADADEQAVHRMCDEWGVRLFCHRADVAALAAAQKCGVEETGRAVRYAFLQETAATLGAKIATAHTLNDQAETVLLHIARGSGLHGLSGIPFQRDNIVRPLLDCTREQVEAYCVQHAIPYVTDSTNAEPDYARNRLRATAIPSLLSVNEAALQHIAQLTQLCREDDAYLESLAAAFIQTHGAHPEQAAMQSLAPPVRKRVFARLADTIGLPALSQHHRAQLSASVESGAAVSVAGNRVAVWQGKPCRLYFVGETAPTVQTALCDGQTVVFGEKTYRFSILSMEEWKNLEKIHKNVLNYAFDYDKIDGGLQLRPRAVGDYLHLAGRAGGKTVKKWMIECGIPAHLRDSIPVVCDGQGVALVAGLGCDARVAVDGTTTKIGFLCENFQ